MKGRALAIAGIAVAAIAAYVLAVNGVAGAGRPDRAGSRSARSLSSFRERHRRDYPVQHLTREWSADLAADPIAMMVSDTDTIVETPFSVVSYETADGRVRWTAKVTDAAPYLAANADTVLVGALDGFVALDRATGATRWRVPIASAEDRVRGVALVATDSDTVAVGATELGGLVGLDAATGTTRWSLAVDGSPRGALAASAHAGVVALVSARGDHGDLRLFDAATGGVRWSDTLPSQSGTPTIAAGLVLVGSGAFDAPGTARAYRVRDGHVAWETPTRAYFKADPAPVVVGDTAYFVDGVGTTVALDRNTGKRRWSHSMTGVAFFLDLVVVDGSVFVTDLLVHAHVLDAATGRNRAGWDWAGLPAQIGVGAGRIVVAQAQVADHQVLGYVPHRMTDVERPDHPAQLRRWVLRQEARREKAEQRAARGQAAAEERGRSAGAGD